MNSKNKLDFNTFFSLIFFFPSISTIAVFITLCFGLTPITAQNCSQTNIIIRQQGAINNFQTNFGPCTTVTGNLIIEDNNNGLNNITNLDGLSGLTSVGGDFRILNNPNLTNIDGVSNIFDIAGNLRIIDNPLINNINGLSKLNSVGGDIGVRDNNNLHDINGLSGLSSVTGDLRVRNNNNLTNVNGLQNINSIGGALAVRNNNSLVECCGLFPVLMNGGANVTGTIEMLGNLAAGNCNNDGADVNMACPIIANIPTLSQWGLLNLALLLMICGTLVLIEGNQIIENFNNSYESSHFKTH